MEHRPTSDRPTVHSDWHDNDGPWMLVSLLTKKDFSLPFFMRTGEISLASSD